MTEEIWKPVPDHSSYEVSDFGRVRNIKTCRILKPRNHNAGYHSVTLGKSIQRTIHSLVAGAFIGSRPMGNDINHKDGNKRNNVLTNLEYVSRKENMRHAREILDSHNRGERHGNSKLKLDQIIAIKQLRKSGHKLDDIAARFGCSFQTISDIARGRRWGWVNCP